MPIRFSLKTIAWLSASVMAISAIHAARADNSYQPYYYQDRDSLQYSNTTAPVLREQGTQPTPPVVTGTGDPRYTNAVNDGMTSYAAPASDAHPLPPREPSTLALGTRAGFDMGIEGAYYHYNEPSPQVQLTGGQIGLLASATAVFGNHMFDTVDFRYDYGRVDYKSPDGTSNDHGNEKYEIRDVIGRDFFWNDTYSVSPYIGVGYRNLYSDERGVTDLGFTGYQRLSQYLYIPIGVNPQVRINGADKLAFNLEYDYFVHGWQTSHLGDAGFGDPTIHNGQDSGVGGIRGSAMWETGQWAFGPYVNYWNVKDSSAKTFISPNATCGATICVGTEPHNITVEGGVQLKYHFFDF